MGVDMSNNPPNSQFSKDFFSSPALSLSLAGIFRGAEAAAARIVDVEEGEEGSGGRRDETVDISSENSGPARSRSEDEFMMNADDDDDDDGGADNKAKNKKRKKYHRHTLEQIREMEALFKDSPHPDEKQRQQLSKQLGLHPRQVKFWFQNRRTQIKVEKLRAVVGKYPPGRVSPTASCSTSNDQDNRTSLDLYSGPFGIERTKIMEVIDKALEELKKMATLGEPMWIRSVETGREILNYDEYSKEFPVETSNVSGKLKRSIEASRESRVVFMDLPRLVQCFMDVNQWKEMFPCLISKAAVVDVICNGEGPNKDGAVQLMYAELQMLTPMVPTREVYFVRYCKQLSNEQWAIVDVSVDSLEDSIDASLIKCRIRPSGCIIEDKSNGHCRVTWVEHMECQKSTVHSLYRTIVNSGLAFGAKHWMSTLQLQCERLVFFMATNVPTKDSSGVGTLAGRKSILKLAHRMTLSFCRALGASTCKMWTKIATKTGEDVRVGTRKNLNDPSEPIGVILCAVSSVWLPVSPNVLFDFLRDDAHRHEWDVMANGSQVQSIASLAKGQDRGNTVSIQTMKSKDNMTWVLQDSSINTYESMVVYAPVEISDMQSVMTGCDSSNVPVLPSGFSILPDGMESRPLVLSSRKEEKSSEGGSLLTIALQVVSNSSSAAKLTVESVEPFSSVISCILGNIKTSLQCEDG
ncbi:homeobox-leucine zipper protein GLABRA 2 isoform X2 [Amaranthus tricolor]|uniref:homeobox-leucine zipper protein GLABRA 2 isoform X2 n=1 Tax=Amaranthus tricolor TaxID=29722 RepID=UPI0025843F5A|nr:homeobox-leucine zipper protein GLABRA 2 isoform X2 [Amaranthus tricolor]